MDTDDLEPRHKAVEKKNLDVMSVDALNGYIADLEAEIARARDAISNKQSARAAADAVFK